MGQALAPVVERLANLETDVAGLKTDVAGLKTDVAGLKTDVAGLKTGFVQMEQQMTELRAALTAGERRQSDRVSPILSAFKRNEKLRQVGAFSRPEMGGVPLTTRAFPPWCTIQVPSRYALIFCRL